MRSIINIINIMLIMTVMFTSLPFLTVCATCHAEDVIILRKENKKGQGADIEIRPTRKHGKIEIRTRL